MATDKVSLSLPNQAKAAQLAGMLFRQGLKDGVCIVNPCSVVDAPKPPAKEIVFLTPEQIKVFLEADSESRFGPL